MKKILFCILYITLGFSLNAQWIPTGGPYGEVNSHDILVKDSIVMVATDCGYFYKTGFEDTWHLAFPERYVLSHLVNDKVFTTGGSCGIYKIDMLYPENMPQKILLFGGSMTHNDTSLLIASDEVGFCQCDFEGHNIIIQNAGLPRDYNPWDPVVYPLITIEFSGNYLFCGTTAGLFRKSFDDSVWTILNQGIPENKAIKIIKAYNDTLYAASSTIFYTSTDSGNHWTSLSNVSMNCLIRQGNIFYMGSDNGVYYSSDNGNSWLSLADSGLEDKSITSLRFYNKVLIAATESKGIFYFTEGIWKHDLHGMVCTNVNSIAATNSSVIIDVTDTLYKYDHNAWVNITPDLKHDYFQDIVTHGDTIFFSVKYDTTWPQYSATCIPYSPDNGNSWPKIIRNVPFDLNGDPCYLYYADGDLYAYGEEYMSITGNLGVTWVDRSLPSQFSGDLYDMIVYKNSIFGAVNRPQGNEVLKYNNGWILSDTGLPLSYGGEKFAVSDSAFWIYYQHEGMFVSRDSGNTWNSANNGLNPDWYVTGYASAGKKLFISTGAGIFGTDNYGEEWSYCGMNNFNTGGLVNFHDTLFCITNGSNSAFTGNGIWKRPVNDIILNAKENSSKKTTYEIYPNPAKDIIHIRSGSDNISFIFYDLAGRLAFSGKTGNINNIDVSSLHEGFYFLHLKENNNSQILKVLIRR